MIIHRLAHAHTVNTRSIIVDWLIIVFHLKFEGDRDVTVILRLLRFPAYECNQINTLEDVVCLSFPIPPYVGQENQSSVQWRGAAEKNTVSVVKANILRAENEIRTTGN